VQQVVEGVGHRFEWVGRRCRRVQALLSDQGEQRIEQDLLFGWVLQGPGPQSTPTTLRLRNSTWLRGSKGIGPAANPMTR
jgi:hypothetical protein